MKSSETLLDAPVRILSQASPGEQLRNRSLILQVDSTKGSVLSYDLVLESPSTCAVRRLFAAATAGWRSSVGMREGVAERDEGRGRGRWVKGGEGG